MNENLPDPLERLKVLANPGANHPILLRAFNELFRENAKIPGGTAGAIILETKTGVLVGDKSHKRKGEERRRQLKKIQDQDKQEHKLTARDKQNLENVLEDLDYALTFTLE
jgi:hypothetical protein